MLRANGRPSSPPNQANLNHRGQLNRAHSSSRGCSSTSHRSYYSHPGLNSTYPAGPRNSSSSRTQSGFNHFVYHPRFIPNRYGFQGIGLPVPINVRTAPPHFYYGVPGIAGPPRSNASVQNYRMPWQWNENCTPYARRHENYFAPRIALPNHSTPRQSASGSSRLASFSTIRDVNSSQEENTELTTTLIRRDPRMLMQPVLTTSSHAESPVQQLDGWVKAQVTRSPNSKMAKRMSSSTEVEYTDQKAMNFLGSSNKPILKMIDFVKESSPLASPVLENKSIPALEIEPVVAPITDPASSAKVVAELEVCTVI